jgi:hypothetical protein
MTLKSKCLGLFILLGGAAISIEAAEAPCAIQSLKGKYELSAAGEVIPMIETEPGKLGVYLYELRDVIVTGTIVIADNEKGKASIQSSMVAEGFPTVEEKGEGTYTVGPDCKGKFNFLAVFDDPKKTTYSWTYDFELNKDGKLQFVSVTGNNKLIAGTAWPADAPAGK